jgi:hypothetical protein
VSAILASIFNGFVHFGEPTKVGFWRFVSLCGFSRTMRAK